MRKFLKIYCIWFMKPRGFTCTMQLAHAVAAFNKYYNFNYSCHVSTTNIIFNLVNQFCHRLHFYLYFTKKSFDLPHL